jgi:peptidyl-prolyl cis-trans isomerase B (cyclophilin B)
MSVRILMFVLASVLASVASSSAQTPAPKPSTDKTPAAAAKPGQTSPGAGPVIVVETEKGTFEFETYPNEAPKTVAHIINLVNKRYYNGQRVHRVEPGFVIQMGDQATRDMTKQEMWGRGNSGTPVGAAEFSKTRTHVRGAVAMAHAGDAAKADAQFYVTLAAAHRLDPDYVVFGKVISGMDVVLKIAPADRIVRVTVRGAK